MEDDAFDKGTGEGVSGNHTLKVGKVLGKKKVVGS